MRSSPCRVLGQTKQEADVVIARTGVEFAAELHDLIGDLYRSYPKLAPLARITIFDVAEKILGAFDAELVKYATEKFSRQGM